MHNFFWLMLFIEGFCAPALIKHSILSRLPVTPAFERIGSFATLTACFLDN